MYHSQNQRIHKEKTKTRNEAPYAELWIGKLRQNTKRRRLQHLWGVNILTYEQKGSYGASYRVKTHKFLCTLVRDTDVPHFTEISRYK